MIETNVFQVSQPGTFTDPFTELLREGARALLGTSSIRHFHKLYPIKSQRSAVQKQLRGRLVLFEWLALLGVGLACAFAASKCS